MPVISRSTSSVVLDSGETASVFVENLGQSLPPCALALPDQQNDMFRVIRDDIVTGAVEKTGWGTGTRLLFLTMSTQGKPSQVITPVVVLHPTEKEGGQPVRGTFLESVVDPTIVYNSKQEKATLFYFVNAWSPPPFLELPEPPVSPPLPPPGATTTTSTTTTTTAPPSPPPFGQYVKPVTLFNGVVPKEAIQTDPDYYENPGYQGPQPFEGEFTRLRDVPNWYTAQDAPNVADIPGSTEENVGPFDLTRFWVAPFTDAHLYRFPESLDGFSDPGKQPVILPPPLPPPPPAPPGSPPTTTTTTTAPPVPADPSQDLLELFPFMTKPQTSITQDTLNVLFKVKNNVTLTSLEYQTYNCYRYAIARILGLTRCTRVLMRAEGMFYNLQLKRDGGHTSKPAVYLVLNHPQPVMAFPRGINKVLVGRPKITTFIGANTFIAGALTYRYPAAGSVTLCGGNPQVDFTIHSPSDRFDENRRMGLLPESLTPQHAPFDTQATYTIPGGYGVTIVELLSNMSAWGV